MSLNGLEAPDITAALKEALRSDAGWLLLQYRSRDEVGLLHKGTQGLPELRTALSDYADKSPLYGLLVYRRQRILLKYIPEGTSRLLQARTNVHFNPIKEKLVPHDHIYDAKEPDDFNEITLSEACSLTAPSPAGLNITTIGSSSVSTGQPPVMHVESNGNKPIANESTTEPTPKPKESPASEAEGRSFFIDNADESPIIPSLPKPVKRGGTDNMMELKAFLQATHPPGPPPNSMDAAERSYSIPTKPSKADERAPSLPNRSTTSDIFSFLKPKIKLSARPATEEQLQRPAASGGFRQKLPAGIRVRTKPTDPERPKTAKSQTNAKGADHYASDLPLRALDAEANAPHTKSFPKPSKLTHAATAPSTPMRQKYASRPTETVPEPPLPPPKSPTSIPPRSDSRSQTSTPKMLDIAAEMEEVEKSPQERGRNFREPIPSLLPPEKQRLMRALQLRKEQRLMQESQEGGSYQQDDSQVNGRPPVPEKDQPSLRAVTPTTISKDSISLSSSPAVESLNPPRTKAQHHHRTSTPLMVDLSVLDGSGVTSPGGTEYTQAEVQALNKAISTTSADSSAFNSVSAVQDVGQVNGKIISRTESPALSVSDKKTSARTESPVLSQAERKVSNRTDSSSVGMAERKTSARTESPTRSGAPHPLRSLPAHIMATEGIPSPLDENMWQLNGLSPATDSEQHEWMDSRAKSPIEYIDISKFDQQEAENAKEPEGNNLLAKVRAKAKRKAKRRGIVDPFEPPQEDNDTVSNPASDDDEMADEYNNVQLEQASTRVMSPISPASRDVSSAGATQDRKTTEPEIALKQVNIGPKARQTPAISAPVNLPVSETSSSTPVQEPRPVSRKASVPFGIAKQVQALAKQKLEERARDPKDARPSTAQTFAGLDSARPRSSSRHASFSRTPLPTSAATTPGLGFSSLPPSRSGQPASSASNYFPRRRETSRVSVVISNTAPQIPQYVLPSEDDYFDFNTPAIPEDRTIEHSRSNSRPSLSRSENPYSIISASSRPGSRDSARTSATRTSQDGAWRALRGSRLRSPTTFSNGSLDRVDELTDSRDQSSRTQRLMRRVSHLRKASLDRAKVSGSKSREDVTDSTSLSNGGLKFFAIGDLNVQFPDSLLWKRRWVEVDTSGNLVLRPARASERAYGAQKKFHLSDFRRPAIPSKDRAEMPNSVVLELVNGGTLQLACEDIVAQSQIFRRLLDAYESWQDRA